MVTELIGAVVVVLVVIFAREIHDSLLRPILLLLMRLSIARQLRRARKQQDQDAAADSRPANVEAQLARMRAQRAERAKARRRMRRVSIRANRRRAAARRSRGHDRAPVLVRRIIAAAPTRKRAA